jgi:hypothetical protein
METISTILMFITFILDGMNDGFEQRNYSKYFHSIKVAMWVCAVVALLLHVDRIWEFELFKWNFETFILPALIKIFSIRFVIFDYVRNLAHFRDLRKIFYIGTEALLDRIQQHFGWLWMLMIRGFVLAGILVL